MERIWGGRKLADVFGKELPTGKRIGESWEIVDRPEAQSIVARGPLKGKTLHELWTKDRSSVFGEPPDGPRFPLLIKLLDAHDRLSLQVHPPERIAEKLRGEPKTEFWYVVAADKGAQLLLGLRDTITRDQFEMALRKGAAADYVHKISVNSGDTAFLPAGRIHAISGGNLLIEIQQNSDTTYRVLDWNRIDPTTGNPRQLQIQQAVQCIDFNDVRPPLLKAKGELLLSHKFFEIQKWELDSPREVAPLGQFAIICCLHGSLRCSNVDLSPGEFCLVQASLSDRQVQPQRKLASLLRITIPA